MNIAMTSYSVGASIAAASEFVAEREMELQKDVAAIARQVGIFGEDSSGNS